jgi:hypothetical protein
MSSSFEQNPDNNTGSAQNELPASQEPKFKFPHSDDFIYGLGSAAVIFMTYLGAGAESTAQSSINVQHSLIDIAEPALIVSAAANRRSWFIAVRATSQRQENLAARATQRTRNSRA